MSGIFFLYGLAFFSLGLVVALEARRTSALALSRHLPWLAAFGLTHGLVEWCDMFLLIGTPASLLAALELTRTLLLPASAIVLGPRRLAETAREAGKLIRNLRNYWQALTEDLGRELDVLSDVKQVQDELTKVNRGLKR